MEPLSLERHTIDAMFAHAHETHPEECCGAIVVEQGRERVLRFTNIQNRLHRENPVENPRDASIAYAPEPRELFAAIKAGDAPGARLAVFYHSHPINGAYFSEEDRKRAMFGEDPSFPEVTYVVVSDARTPGEVRGFRWDDASSDFAEVPITVRA
jgi:proteasome lid subunit RPN8/RPN11